MKRAKPFLSAAGLIVLGTLLWTLVFPGPEKVIRKRLAEVARAASFTANEGALPRLAHVRELMNRFSPDVEFVFDVPRRGQHSFTGRDELMQRAMAVRSVFTSLKVEFLDANIELAADRQSAVADLTVQAMVPGDKDFLVQEMKFTLKKIDGDWLIIRVETVKTLSQENGVPTPDLRSRGRRTLTAQGQKRGTAPGSNGEAA